MWIYTLAAAIGGLVVGFALGFWVRSLWDHTPDGLISGRRFCGFCGALVDDSNFHWRRGRRWCGLCHAAGKADDAASVET